MATTTLDGATRAGVAALMLAGLLGTVGCQSRAAQDTTAVTGAALQAAAEVQQVLASYALDDERTDATGLDASPERSAR